MTHPHDLNRSQIFQDQRGFTICLFSEMPFILLRIVSLLFFFLPGDILELELKTQVIKRCIICLYLETPFHFPLIVSLFFVWSFHCIKFENIRK